MSTYDPFNWQKVTNNEGTAKGRLRLQASVAGALYIARQGYEACAGYGTEFDLRISGEFEFRFVPSVAKGEIFVYSPEKIVPESSGTIYTNADMRSLENGHVAEVRQLLRQHDLQVYAVLQESRANLAQAKLLRNQQPRPAEVEALQEAEASENPHLEGEIEEGA